MSEHTKGPWRLVINDTGGRWSGWPLCICPEDGGDDRSVVRPGGQWPYEWDAHTSQMEAVANGRLIAAAPDLLEAARNLVRWAEDPSEDSTGMAREQNWLEQARQAISKATNPQHKAKA